MIPTEYLQFFTEWVKHHAEWALVLAFLISFIESLAIIGSLVPGSIMMTFLGVLAGSGLMRIDLTLIVSICGAIVGDSTSYWLGHQLSDQLPQKWPFNRYPKWLAYGQSYFERHGGKSVFLGRFIGPLRSIIPVIAGMMHMRYSSFFLANTLSAIPWALVYVGPGLLIGVASTELSTEQATSLFFIILVALLGLWLLTLALKTLWHYIQKKIQYHLHRAWSYGLHSKHTSSFMRWITPKHETDHSKTLGLFILLILMGVSSLISLSSFLHIEWFEQLNFPCYYLFQSLRTPNFDRFFTYFLPTLSPISLFTFLGSIFGISLNYQKWRLFCYFLSLSLFAFSASILMNDCLSFFDQQYVFMLFPLPNYFSISLTIWVSLISFGLSLFYKKRKKAWVKYTKRCFSLIFIGLCLSLLYFGKIWLSSLLSGCFIGLTLSLGHFMLYRRSPSFSLPLPVLFIPTTVLLLTVFILNIYDPKQAQDDQTGWATDPKQIPQYTNNRLGHIKGWINIHYTGHLNHFKTALSQEGWTVYSSNFLKQLLRHIPWNKTNSSMFELPTALYLHQKPVLSMIYYDSDTHQLWVLHLWKSSYPLNNSTLPFWIGSIDAYDIVHGEKKKTYPISLHPFYKIFNPTQFHSSIQTISHYNLQTEASVLIKIEEKP